MDVVVLAAGLGTRLKSSKPKVLHKIFEKPIIDYVIDCAKNLNPSNLFIVINPALKEVGEHLEKYPIKIVFQDEPKGTAHALLSALPYLSSEKILILNGDTPLIRKETLDNLIELFNKNKIDMAILSFYPQRQHSYGRILRDETKKITKIVEITDITDDLMLSSEANSGVYILKRQVAELVREIKQNPKKGEFYLTDIVELAIHKGFNVEAYPIAEEDELIGINTRAELSLAIKYLRDRIVKEWMDKGITFYDSTSVWISPSVTIGQDTIIYPNVFLEGHTKIGQNCLIYQGVRIKDSIIEDNVQINDCTVIENSYIKSGSKIGPFAHIRPNTIVGKNCRIGNFVEIKNATIGDTTKAAHLSYIGDSEIGNNVNIGAGTITCNYDGQKKHKTIIEDNVFVGSDTQLIAPVKICKGAYIAAGSTITKDVPEESLAISRTPQENILDWVKKKRKK